MLDEHERLIDYRELATQYQMVIVEMRRMAEEETGVGSEWQAGGAGRGGGRAGERE